MSLPAVAENRVTLFNPWGSYVTVNLNSIVGETYCVWRLRDNNTYTGDGGNANNNQQQNAPQTTDQPAEESQPTSSRRRGGNGTKTLNANIVNAQPTGNEKQVDSQPKGGVVWVTEVVTVTVNV